MEILDPIRIFVASPTGLGEERRRLSDVVQYLGQLLDLQLEILDWRKQAPPDAGRPEEVILRHIKPETWDVFVGILWHRFGTPSGGTDPESHKPYQSGTEEEFRTAWDSAKKTGRPRVMMYQCERPVPPKDLDARQLARVQKFFRDCDADGAHPALWKTYSSVQQFEQQVRLDLGLLLKERAAEARPKDIRKREPQTAQLSLPKVAEQRKTKARGHAAAQYTFSVAQLMELYDFPKGLDGSGQCIGLIELGGGYRKQDLEEYFRPLKLPVPKMEHVSVDGARNAPAKELSGADPVVALDIEVCGTIAPRAEIVVYFAPNTNEGFVHAIQTAVEDKVHKPSVISINWGQAESGWPSDVLKEMDEALASGAAKGITVCCASGDSGVADPLNPSDPAVDFPASSPHVLAVGGTTIKASANAIAAETVWNDGANGGATGGGVSAVFALPEWQAGVKVSPASSARGRFGRLVPDVAAHASPSRGYEVVVHGQRIVIGGTTASTDIWAGLIALLNQALGRRVGLFTPALYKTFGPARVLRPITKGNNSTAKCPGFEAGPGWNACTGWGSPNGRDLLTALRTLGEA